MVGLELVVLPEVSGNKYFYLICTCIWSKRKYSPFKDLAIVARVARNSMNALVIHVSLFESQHDQMTTCTPILVSSLWYHKYSPTHIAN